MYDFSSTQLNLPTAAGDMLLRFGDTIDPVYLAAAGLETEPHVTVVYGLPPVLTAQQIMTLRLIADEFNPIPLRFLPTATFPLGENSNTPGVVFVPVVSDALMLLHDRICAELPVTTTHPLYHPHATVGYLEPEAVFLYVGQDVLRDVQVVVEHLVVSAADGSRVVLPFHQAPSFGARMQALVPFFGRKQISTGT